MKTKMNVKAGTDARTRSRQQGKFFDLPMKYATGSIRVLETGSQTKLIEKVGF